MPDGHAHYFGDDPGHDDATGQDQAPVSPAPTFAGLYQINVLIPQTALTGNVPVSLILPGHNSNLVDIAIAAQ